MRRFFLFCVFIICFLCAGFLKGETFSIYDGSQKQNQSYVLSEQYSNLSLEEKKVRYFDLCEMLKVNLNNVELVGETKYFNLESFKQSLNLKIISCGEVAGRLVLTGFSSKLRKFVYVNGQRVNVQVSLSTDLVKVGSPLILGSF